MSFSSGADDEAPTTGKSKQTTNVKKREFKLKVKYKSWERFFSEMVRLNVIQNSTKKIFCLKSEHWHSSPCYPTVDPSET